LLAVGIVLAVLVNLPAALQLRISGGVKDALAPAAGWLRHGFGGCRQWLAGPAELAAANRRLLGQVGQLQWEISRLRALDRENSELRRLLGLEERWQYRLVAAQVTDRSIGGWWQMARLDKGTADGMQVDQPVISAEGLVGRIVAVSALTSDVLFLVDPDSKVSARLARVDAFGIVQGQGVSLRGDSICRMDFIMKEADIQPGDEVVTSGLGGVYPPGLVIGYVTKNYLDRSGLYQRADIVPAADLRLLGFVLVVLREPPAERRPAPAEAGQAGRP
jgi:rod shape-determining protein MreC